MPIALQSCPLRDYAQNIQGHHSLVQSGGFVHCEDSNKCTAKHYTVTLLRDTAATLVQGLAGAGGLLLVAAISTWLLTR